MKHTKVNLNIEQGAKIIRADFIAKASYASNWDIYDKGKQETGIDPDDAPVIKDINETYKAAKIVNGNMDVFGAELDVHGYKLDDQEEISGSEDDEYNYYILGLDNHNELPENRE